MRQEYQVEQEGCSILIEEKSRTDITYLQRVKLKSEKCSIDIFLSGGRREVMYGESVCS